MSLSSNKMRAVSIENPGKSYQLKITEQERPVCGPYEVLIKTHAFGVNRPDIIQSLGMYPPPAGVTDIPGLEISGEIVEIGADVTQFKMGDRVCALLAGGGYAEYVAAPAAQVLPVPENISMIQAAAIPECFFTVWHNLEPYAKQNSGQRILIHGGSSGIGTTAIKLAKYWDITPIVTCGNADKIEFCRQVGAQYAIDYKKQDFVEIVQEITDGKGVDLVLDMVGGDYLDRNMDVMKHGGIHISIAMLRGMKAEINIKKMMQKRLVLTGSTLRGQDISYKGAIARQLQEHIWPIMASQQMQPEIDSVFCFDEIKKAHEHMQSSEHMGKIVIDMTA